MVKKLLFVLNLFVFIQSAVAQEPTNLGVLREQLVQYYESGDYQRDMQQATEPAKQYLLQRVELNKQLSQPKKLAIVFDIDETVISNFSFMKRMRFGGTIAMFDKAGLKADATVIKPVQELYNLALKNRVAVFFVSGRRENLRAATEQNLRQTGYQQWTGLMLKPLAFQANSASVFKATQRERIAQQGYDIILNVGDQQSDLKGCCADRLVKLPNPFYFVP